MFDFSNYLDLPYTWGCLLALSLFLYVFLDGFDLGTGILFPFAPSDTCRDRMMNSISPFWDGNETWLIFSGGGLLAAFPIAYSILMPALYLPIYAMLLGLILRGISFEFRFKSELKYRQIWDYCFHFGSLIVTFSQGLILGAFIQGFTIVNQAFAGSTFDWLSAFSMMTGLAMVFGNALLGSTWLIMKTDGKTQAWAYKAGLYTLMYVLFFISLVSLWTPFIHPSIWQRWFTWPNIAWFSPVPIVTTMVALGLVISIKKKYEVMPFVLSIGLYLLSYVGLAISLWPWIVPFKLSFRDCAANGHSLSFLLVGTALCLPIILAFTIYNYCVFRGKTSHESLY